MKLAYLISRYPAVSHTFILREVQALRRLNFEVSTISIRRAHPGQLLTDADRAEAASTTNILPPRLGTLVGDHLATLATRPRRYFSTLARALRLRRHGIRGLLWVLFYFVEAVMVFRLCGRKGIRHLHAHFANVASDVALLAAHLGADRGMTFSFTMHGPTEFYEVSRHRLADKITAANFVVCISDFCRSQLMALVNSEHWAKLRVVHCGVDTATFAPVPGESRSAEAHKPAPEILCVGRLVPEKGQALLLEAAADLIRRGRALHVTFVGDGPDRRSLEAKAASLGIALHVNFTGSIGQERIREYYARADLFCLPSFAEGVPVVLMEAMAMGIPVVTTRVMGIPELVEHAVGGLLVAPGRADQLALALDHLLDAPGRRQQLGKAAREKILADFDLRRVGPQLAEIFRAAAGATAEGRGGPKTPEPEPQEAPLAPSRTGVHP